MKVKIKKLRKDAIIPSYFHDSDAGADLCSCDDYVLKPGERALIKTGLSIALPLGYEAQIRPKSGLALKHGLSIVNTPGTIDAGYRGEIGVIIINHGAESFKIEKGNKIAQMVINEIKQAEFEEVDDLDETNRGKGGFGSTG